MRAFLILETGEIFSGETPKMPDAPVTSQAYGKAGEVVFNTSHSGYEEIATDPSYFSQIMVMTAPMQGNYGADRAVWESRQVWIEGFIATEIQDSPRDQSWLKLLLDKKVMMLTGLDTRKIVLRLRELGTPWGAIVVADSEVAARALAVKLIAEKKQMPKDWVYEVSRRETEFRKGLKPNGPRIAIMDYGCKENTLRELMSRSSELAIFPSRTLARTIQDWQADGLMLANGPGDPADVKIATEVLRELVGKLPVFGICMGHQLLSLALGAKTYRLKFGHRGSNHPVRDELVGQIYMTSQNHGYAVDDKSLPANVKVSHRNLNDHTVEGIVCESLNCFSVQYHPESHPGPREASILFDYFASRINR